MNLKIFPLLIIAILFVAGLTPAQSSAAPDAVKDVKLQLAFADGKAVYRIGEPITLVLSYSATQPGYVVERYYSPRFDDVIVSPTDGVYDWLNRLNRLYSYDHISAPMKLSQTPVDIKIMVNSLVRFDKPGKYKIKVVSRRVGHSNGDFSLWRRPLPFVSNEVELEIKEMTEAEERAEVKRITALMDSANNLNQHQIFKRELDYLTGDVSTVEKVRRFLKPPVFGGVTWLDSGTGLNIARNKELAVKLLEDALRDLNREPNRYLISQLVTLRLSLEDERQPSRAKTAEQLWKEREPRSAELTKAYYAELFDSLPKRAGRSRIAAAYTIFTSLPKGASDNAFDHAKTFLLENFDEMTPYERVDLLDYHWDKIKTPSLIPSLIKILSEKEPVPAWNVRANALKRLIELDQKRARPFVIAEIRDPNSTISPDILRMLDDKFLPEVDAALLEQIQKLASTKEYRIQFKLLLAARYATRKIYKELLDVYKKYESGWTDAARGPLLAYLLRHNDKEAVSLVEEKLAKWFEKSGSHIFFQLTRISLPEGLEKILRKRLENDEAEVAGTAAYYLSKYAGKENQSLIEKRYHRWLAKWSGRGAELENTDASAAVKSEAMFQVNLLLALIGTEKRRVSENEVFRLRLTCLTDNCRRRFRARP